MTEEKAIKNEPKTRAEEYLDPETKKFKEGNPGGGRPKGSVSIVGLLKNELEKEIELGDNREKITYAKALIRKILKKAIVEEDVRMIIDIINRVDGTPKQAVDLGIDDEIRSFRVEIVNTRTNNEEDGDKKLD